MPPDNSTPSTRRKRRRQRTKWACQSGDPSLTPYRDAAYLASFPEQNPNPIVEADLEGHIRYANPVAIRLFPALRGEAPHTLGSQIGRR